jgi:hypothetical protein
VQTTIFRAGSAWRLRAPFPVPAARFVTVVVEPPTAHQGSARAVLRDIHGVAVAVAEVATLTGEQSITVVIEDVAAGLYNLVLEDNHGLITAFPVIVAP